MGLFTYNMYEPPWDVHTACLILTSRTTRFVCRFDLWKDTQRQKLQGEVGGDF